MSSQEAMKYRVGFSPKISRWPNSINEEELVRSTTDYQVLSRSKDTLIWRNTKIAQPKNLIYKLYFGRGSISWIRFHLTKFRVQREFEALFYLEQKQLPASRPVAWTKGRNLKLGDRYEVLVTEEIPNATPFIDLWEDVSIKKAQKIQLLNQCMQLISQMHEAGLHHGAMYPRNILMQQLDDVSYTPYIIDVPMALVCYHSLKGDKLANIDLKHFLYSLKNCLPEEEMAQAIEVYGKCPQGAKNLALQIHNQPPPIKHTRNYQRTYARFRSYFVKV